MSKLNESAFLSVAAFEDSVDVEGQYQTGICGEKRMALASDTPDYLSIELAIGEQNLVSAPFKIIYDHQISTFSDVGLHTVNYTVSFIEYADIV